MQAGEAASNGIRGNVLKGEMVVVVVAKMSTAAAGGWLKAVKEGPRAAAGLRAAAEWQRRGRRGLLGVVRCLAWLVTS